MRAGVAVLAITGLLAGCATQAPEPAQGAGDAAVAQVVKVADAESITTPVEPRQCADETTTGSRIPKRVCMTEGERDAVRDSSQDFHRRIVRPMSGPPEARD